MEILYTLTTLYSLTFSFITNTWIITITVALVHGPSGTIDTGFHGLGTLRDEHGMVVTKKGVLQQGRWKDDKLIESRPVV